jgi:ATP-dependent Lhr-like helicase
VLVDGTATAYLERGGASLPLFPAADDPVVLRLTVTGLYTLIADGRVRDLVIKKVDGEPVASAARRDELLTAGFVPGYRGLTLRRG